MHTAFSKWTVGRAVLALVPLMATSALCADDPYNRDELETLPPAVDVLARVRAAFPPQPLVLRGQLIVLNKKGDEIRSQAAEIRLDWKAAVPTAQFEVRDSFGALVSRLVIRRPAGQSPEYELFTGTTPEPNRSPDLTRGIADTDFSWEDLALDCLWWTKGETVETHMKKGRKCYVVDLVPPAPRPGLARVRLFVDSEVYAILRAETFNEKNEATRRMEVKSLQKIDDLWTLQDLEMRRYPSDQRTLFRVDNGAGKNGQDTVPKVSPADIPSVTPVAAGPGDSVL